VSFERDRCGCASCRALRPQEDHTRDAIPYSTVPEAFPVDRTYQPTKPEPGERCRNRSRYPRIPMYFGWSYAHVARYEIPEPIVQDFIHAAHLLEGGNPQDCPCVDCRASAAPKVLPTNADGTAAFDYLPPRSK